MSDECRKIKKRQICSETNPDWELVEHFFIWRNSFSGQYYIVLIYKDGQIFLEQIKGKKNYTKYHDLWKLWEEKICIKKELNNFTFSVWNIVQDYKNWCNMRMSIVTGMSFAVAMFLLLPLISTPLKHTILPKSQLIFAIMLVLSNILTFTVIKKRQDIVNIMLSDNNLRVVFADGIIKELPLQGFKKYAFNINAYSSFMVFKDGTCLTNLQRISYWPILRKKLLEKLEPEKKI